MSDYIAHVCGPLTLHTLEIRNSSHNGINVPDANLVPVSSTSDVLKLMNLGQNNRAVSSTAMNDRSSRSHRYRLSLSLKFFNLKHSFHFKQQNPKKEKVAVL